MFSHQPDTDVASIRRARDIRLLAGVGARHKLSAGGGGGMGPGANDNSASAAALSGSLSARDRAARGLPTLIKRQPAPYSPILTSTSARSRHQHHQQQQQQQQQLQQQYQQQQYQYQEMQTNNNQHQRSTLAPYHSRAQASSPHTHSHVGGAGAGVLQESGRAHWESHHRLTKRRSGKKRLRPDRLEQRRQQQQQLEAKLEAQMLASRVPALPSAHHAQQRGGRSTKKKKALRRSQTLPVVQRSGRSNNAGATSYGRSLQQLQAGGYNGETRTSARRAGGGGSGLTAAQEVALQQARVDELMVEQAHVSKLTDALNDAKSQLGAAAVAIKQKDEEIAKVKRKLEVHDGANKRSNRAQKKASKEAVKQLQEAQKKAEELQAALEQTKTRCEQEATKAKSFESVVGSLKTRVSTLQQRNEALQARVAETASKHTAAVDASAAGKQSLVDLQTQLTDKTAEAERLKKTVATQSRLLAENKKEKERAETYNGFQRGARSNGVSSSRRLRGMKEPTRR